MITSTISQTKDHLSGLLEKVQQGETLIILDRKKPIARVERIDHLDANPHLLSPRSKSSAIKALLSPIGGRKGKSSKVLAALLEERERSL